MTNSDNTCKYVIFPFKKNGQLLPADEICCGMTVKAAGSMRFRWAEHNNVRNSMLQELAGRFNQKTFVPVELNHTQIVYDVAEAGDTPNKVGDGIITRNRNLIPTITVADCVPIFLYDSVTGVFGIVHSGWKGTGIIAQAISLAEKNYGSKPEDFSVTIGPHIHDCCYIVNEERAEYFRNNFTPDCIRELEPGITVDWNNGGGKLYRLSLEKANLAVLKKAGVPEANINLITDCTCCSKNGFYGSNRRETKENGLPDKFTVQAAFCVF